MPPLAQRIARATARELVVRTDEVVRIGPMRVRIRSNEAQFSSLRYFPRASERHRGAIDYTLNLCNVQVDGPWPLEALIHERDASYRARRFAGGYYLTDHFGERACLLSEGREYYVFAADFEPILWPCLVKLLLTLYSMETSCLHLKAAALAIEGKGTLLVGRGGGGKTVLLAQLCQQGAQFLSNTHTLIDAGSAIGIPSALRVRRDALFGALIAERELRAGIKPGEFVADPVVDLGWQPCERSPVRRICLVDYRGAGRCELLPLDREILFRYMEQFALALNVYGLKEDVLDHLGGDVSAFAAHLRRWEADLRTLVEGCEAFKVSCDLTDTATLKTLHALLSD